MKQRTVDNNPILLLVLHYVAVCCLVIGGYGALGMFVGGCEMYAINNLYNEMTYCLTVLIITLKSRTTVVTSLVSL